MGGLLPKLGPFPCLPPPALKRVSHYRYLAKSIISQQLSGKAAETIHKRICALSPGPLFPSVREFLNLPPDLLRQAGLSGSKRCAIADLATRLEAGSLCLSGVSRQTDQDIVSRLTEVHGIGPWTAQMFLLFKLGRLDILPAGDLGVQEGVRILDGLASRPGPAEIRARTNIWAPLRSIGTLAMWRLVDGTPTT